MVMIDDAILRLLVRFFRTGRDVIVNDSDELVMPEDVQYLRVHWSLSRQLDSLAQHLLENRHEAQATIEAVQSDLSAQVRGRIDATRTVLRRRLTGDPSQVSCIEPRRSFREGPNHVLLWVLKYSHHVLRQYSSLLSNNEEYERRVRRVTANLGRIHHMWGIGDAIATLPLTPRPSPMAEMQARKSRRWLYRKACSAYQLLHDVEHGQMPAIKEMLSGSLLGPMEQWQKFELLLALRIGQALAELCGQRLELRPIQRGGNRPLATVGPFDVYWQSRTPLGGFPEPEPSEVIVQEILNDYGVRAGYDRPDVVVCNRHENTVTLIAEAKYSTGEVADWQTAFRDATTQLVRYSRLYCGVSDQRELLRRSLIAVSNLPMDVVRMAPETSPMAINLGLLMAGDLSGWISRINHLVDASSSLSTSSTLR